MKKFKLLIMICIFILCIAGCKQKQYAEQPDTTTVTVAVRNGEKSTWESITGGFSTDNPDIKLKFIELGSEFEQYRLLTAALSSGECAFDIMEIEDVWVDEFVQSGYMHHLPDNMELDDDYFASAKLCFERDKKLYAVPFQVDLGMILASKEYGWNGDIYSLRSENTNNAQKQTAGDSSEETDIISPLMELVAYTGGDASAALKLYKDIYAGEFSGGKVLKLFGNGELPVARAWSSVLPRFRGERHNISGGFNVYNIPIGRNGAETSVAKIFGLGISLLTEHKEACELFVEYCSTDEFQTAWIAETGTYPARMSLFDAPTVISEWNHIPVMKDRIQNVQIRPHGLNYAETTDKLQQSIELYLTDSISLEEVAPRLEEFLK